MSQRFEHGSKGIARALRLHINWLWGGVMTRSDLSAKQVVRELKEKGVVCLESFFDPSFVEKMRREAAILNPTQPQGNHQVRIYPRTVRDPQFSTLGQALNDDFCREVALSYDHNCKFFLDAVIEHVKIAEKKITDIHFDLVRSLKFMIYLSDVDKQSAAFRYCVASHKENRKLRNRFLIMGGGASDVPNVPGPSEGYVLTDMEGPRGTLIIFDTEGFHSAGTLQKEQERLLVRSRTRLSSWFDNTILQRAAKLNPLRACIPLLVPQGRRPTRGRARAQQDM